MRFHRYHAAGNDYIVMHEAEFAQGLTPALARRICDRNFGVGSDGILLHRNEADTALFHLQIWNPDGSLAEKSGNGLRIFSRYLRDQGLVGTAPFRIATDGGVVTAEVSADAHQVKVEMGALTFESTKIPVAGPPREVLRERFVQDGVELEYSCASIGNPHCVLLREAPSEEEARRFGPLIEVDPRFPNRTNVQFMRVRDRGNIEIRIWERGAGYTLASGSSSSAAAGVAHKLGLCDRDITVHMPGGKIRIELDEAFRVRMTGPVTRIADGVVHAESLEGAA